jgi:hypothetical protein
MAYGQTRQTTQPGTTKTEDIDINRVLRASAAMTAGWRAPSHVPGRVLDAIVFAVRAERYELR